MRSIGADQAFPLGELSEELGYDSVWVPEFATFDAIAVACVVAARTERIRIGTSIIPFTTRSAALHAMAASTLGHLAPGRSVLGYGVSTKLVIADWHGEPMPAAVTAARDVFAILDESLAGQATDHEGTVASSHGLRLEFPPPQPPLRFVGALGPKMRRLARESCDGLLLNFAPRSSLRALADAERPGDRPFEMALPIRVALADDLDEQMPRFRREVASYLRVPVYARWLRELGWDEVVDSISDLGSLQAMAEALPDAFVEDMGLFGDADECGEKIAAMRADGVTPLLIPVVEPGDITAFEKTIAALAPGS
jgi:probable F420-dependent oxidoreductase